MKNISSILVSIILSVFITLSFAYIFNIIYLVGDPRELDPLFIGLLIGAFLFSISGIIPSRKNKLIGLIIAAISLIIVYSIITFTSMSLNFTEFFIVSFLVASVEMPITGYFFSDLPFKGKFFYSIMNAFFSIILILIFAIIYEKSGQTILPLGISIFAYISIILSILWVFNKRRMIRYGE